MTRFARGGSANKKKPHEGSTWDDLHKNKQDSKKADSGAENSGDTSDKQFKRKAPRPPTEIPDKTKPKDNRTDRQDDKFRKFQKFGQKGKRDKQVLKDRQREKRRLKRKQERDSQKVCYNCREPGHHLADCPLIQKDQEQGTGICFKCGSTEHSSASCRVKVPPGEYPFAKCFICGEKGHISKQCPDNPRGLYPKGGCCKHCGSVEHFRKDCPELQKEQGIQDFTLETISSNQSADSQGDNTEQYIPVKKKKKKVVNF